MVKKKTESYQEIELLKSQLARALADYDNLKKRYEREQEEIVQRASERLLVKLLPVMDLFETISTHADDQGLVMAIDQFKQVLSESGVNEVRPNVGDSFDEQKHEAIDVVNAQEGQEGHIAEIVATGLIWKDGRLIKAAKVKVYGGKLDIDRDDYV